MVDPYASSLKDQALRQLRLGGRHQVLDARVEFRALTTVWC
ncbi:hypothetical protein [Streptomyces sp. A1547]|nr:hypothetical protein [Streptomyces sp. A1547]